MTKKQIIRELKDVLDGTSGHSVAQIWKEKNHWYIETDISSNNFEYNESSRIFRHSCNFITLKETNEILENAFC